MKNENIPIELIGKIIYKQFINKGGRLIEGAGDYFLEMEEGCFFIKFYEGNVLRTAIAEKLGQTIKVVGYTTKGLWDATDVQFQSRIGKYVVINELV